MKRWIPIAVLIIALIAFFAFGGQHYLSFAKLKTHHEQLKSWTENYYLTTIFLFCLIYIISVSISIPGAAILTLVAGYLFGAIVGTTCVVISATIGATAIFLAVKTSLGDILRNKAGSWVSKMEKGLSDNALSYMFFLRLVPLFPFWAINIVAGILNVPLKPYVIATFFGMIPGSLVYVLVGNSLNTVLAAGETPNMKIIFEPKILIPILLLALLSLTPILYKKFKQKNG